MCGVIPKNKVTISKILALDIFIIAIKNNKINDHTCYIMFPLKEYEKLFMINRLHAYWDGFEQKLLCKNQTKKSIDAFLSSKNVVFNCIFKQISLDYIRYDLQNFKDYILCQRRLYLFLILHNAEHGFFLTNCINAAPTYHNWLKKLMNYKCIIQSKKFTSLMKKHREFKDFLVYKKVCYGYLIAFCSSIQLSIMEQHKTLKIFFYFQTVHELICNDVNGMIAVEIQAFFVNSANEKKLQILTSLI
ncbi:hypothetical protein COBT_001403 [Conglomerata obtusa]